MSEQHPEYNCDRLLLCLAELALRGETLSWDAVLDLASRFDVPTRVVEQMREDDEIVYVQGQGRYTCRSDEIIYVAMRRAGRAEIPAATDIEEGEVVTIVKTAEGWKVRGADAQVQTEDEWQTVAAEAARTIERQQCTMERQRSLIDGQARIIARLQARVDELTPPGAGGAA